MQVKLVDRGVRSTLGADHLGGYRDSGRPNFKSVQEEAAYLRQKYGRFCKDLIIYGDGTIGLNLSSTQLAKLVDGDLNGLNLAGRLSHLQIWSEPLTDEGLSHLGGLSSLRFLLLCSEKITNKGMEILMGSNLTSLQGLDISRCRMGNNRERISQGMINRMRECWPGIGIDY
jgi:hypothetical protein